MPRIDQNWNSPVKALQVWTFVLKSILSLPPILLFLYKNYIATSLFSDLEIISARIYTRFRDPEVNYLVDTTSLVKLVPDVNWKTEANVRIENFRKSDITLK